ncbi:putative protein FAM90A12P [Eptesicus fuscus]|uniref:putative protein FAM90A12P n=1 Tax=Eptesicus fuscus TaxID=29078 RepID=UPI00240457DC|nr:putative protein FAM90A12P [Eptesicus fuscus]
MAQKGKQPQRAPVAHKAPPPEEENPRVRCWKCGAFGHKASSLRCPMKRHSGALAAHALGSNEMKESRNPWNPRDLSHRAPFNKAARLTQQRVRNEQHRQDLRQRLRQRARGGPQHNWKDKTESCDYVRDPHKPRPDHNTKRKYVRDPDITTLSPKTKRVMTSTAPPIKGVERSACLPPGPKNGQEEPVTDSPQTGGTHFVQDPTHRVHERENGPHSAFRIQGLDLIHQPQAKFPDGNSLSIQHAIDHSVGQDADLIIKVPGKRAAQTSSQTFQKPTKKARPSPCLKSTQSPDPQPLHQGILIKTLQPCHVPLFPPIPGVPEQPRRKVFQILDKGPWSSMPMTTHSHPPAEKLTTFAQISPTTEKSEALCPCVPLSVLLEALQLSSSSEGDGQ